MKTSAAGSESETRGSAHLLRVDYKDGTGFWVHRGGVPIAGTKAEMDTLSKTVAWAGGMVLVVVAGAPNACVSRQVGALDTAYNRAIERAHKWAAQIADIQRKYAAQMKDIAVLEREMNLLTKGQDMSLRPNEGAKERCL